MTEENVAPKFDIGDRVTKIKGSKWTGIIVGFYCTELTPIGYAVESEAEKGSVQIYPEAALVAHPWRTAASGRVLLEHTKIPLMGNARPPLTVRVVDDCFGLTAFLRVQEPPTKSDLDCPQVTVDYCEGRLQILIYEGNDDPAVSIRLRDGKIHEVAVANVGRDDRIPVVDFVKDTDWDKKPYRPMKKTKAKKTK